MYLCLFVINIIIIIIIIIIKAEIIVKTAVSLSLNTFLCTRLQ